MLKLQPKDLEKRYCKYCSSTIEWIKNSNGINLPVVPGANVVRNEVYDPNKHQLHRDICPKWPLEAA